MKSRVTLVIVALLVLCAATWLWFRCQPFTPPLFEADFSDPGALADWSVDTNAIGHTTGIANVVTTGGNPFMRIESGAWESRAFTPGAHELYRVRFRARTEAPLYWVIYYYDAEGQFLAPSPYDRVYGTGKWMDFEGFARVHPDTARMHLRFEVNSGHSLDVTDIRIERVPPYQVQAGMRRLGRTLPAVRYRAPVDRWEHLNRTRNALRRGIPWRIVMVGDSICADIANSLFDVRLGARWMTSRIELVNSVRRSTGPWYFTQPDALEHYVLRHEPDLLIITGISHGRNPEGHRALVRAVRKHHDCDILLMPGSIAGMPVPKPEIIAATGKAANQAHIDHVTGFPDRLRLVAEEEQVAYLDIRRAWDSYITNSDRPHEWYMRDGVHANGRGKYVVGEIMVRFLAP